MQLQYEKLMARPPSTVTHSYTERDMMDVRFSKPVYPGETLRTDAWQLDHGSIAFRCSVPSRGVTVIDNGRFDFI